MGHSLDHLIVPVNKRVSAQSVQFFTGIVGLVHEGERPPFSVVRVSSELTLQLAP